MSFYQQSGVLFFGTRLRRLSETFLADVNKVYQQHHIHFDAAWFPVFFILSKQDSVSISQIAEELETSHSAASQLTTKLQEKGLLKAMVSKADARKKMISLTPKGQKLLQQVQPIWTAMQTAMDELLQQSPETQQLMTAIAQTEQAFQQQSIFHRIEKHLQP